jgi:hypothetical protein
VYCRRRLEYQPKMPVFHTKTIESILEPVASQVIELAKKVTDWHFCFVFNNILASRHVHVCRFLRNRSYVYHLLVVFLFVVCVRR